jgi:hypothetical protein
MPITRSFRPIEIRRCAAESKRALTTNPPWFRVLLFGMPITSIGKGNSVRLAFRRWRAKSEAAPATVSG